jgi:hypothetical protein
VKQDMDHVIDKINAFEKNIDELNNKLLDFNIYDIFKSAVSDPSKGNTNIDHTVLLVQNLDQKTMKKFESYDEKIKKNLDDIYKLRNEVSSIKSISLKTQENQENFIIEEKKKNVVPHTDHFNQEEFQKEFDKKLNELNSSLSLKINE